MLTIPLISMPSCSVWAHLEAQAPCISSTIVTAEDWHLSLQEYEMVWFDQELLKKTHIVCKEVAGNRHKTIPNSIMVIYNN